jgi:hypothetical protein
MSEFPPGTFLFAERTMDLSVHEARRDARKRRLQREAGAGRETSHHFYFRALARLGQHLTSWGARLQERYNADESISMSLRA